MIITVNLDHLQDNGGDQSSDPLWDGQQCNGTKGPCCTNSKMPWFIKSLNGSTVEDVEVRVCGSQGGNNEDTPLDIIEFYIR